MLLYLLNTCQIVLISNGYSIGFTFLGDCELNIVEYSKHTVINLEFTVCLLYSTIFNSQSPQKCKPYGISVGNKDYLTSIQQVKQHGKCLLPCCASILLLQP